MELICLVVFSFSLQVWKLQVCWLFGDGLVRSPCGWYLGWCVLSGLQGAAGTLLSSLRPQRCSRSPAGSRRVCCLSQGLLELSAPCHLGFMGVLWGSIPANRHTGMGCCESALWAGREWRKTKLQLKLWEAICLVSLQCYFLKTGESCLFLTVICV